VTSGYASAPSAATPAPLTIDLRYWMSVLRRRFWWFLLVWVLIAAVGVGVAYVLPPVYQAKASILVESQQISTDLVRSTVTDTAAERIAVIRQRLLTRDILLDIDVHHGVYANRPDLAPNERVEAMRRAIDLDQIDLDRSRGWRRGEQRATAFSVSFTASSPGIAAAVVNDLVTRILEQNASLRQSRAAITADFFAQESERLGRELADIEARIITFMEANEESLPDSLDYRRDQIDLLQERLRGLELRRLELEQERASLNYILNSVESPSQTELQRALEAARLELTERGALLSPEHPEVRGLRNRVAAYERAVVAEVEARANDDGRSGPPPSPAAVEARRRLGFLELQIEYIGAQMDDIQAERQEVQRTILATPSTEVSLNALRRAYDETEKRYQSSREKLAEARMGEQLEDKQQAERFEVIEQARPPAAPVSPNRPKIAMAGVAGGAGAGLALILLMELSSGVVRRSSDLRRIHREPVAALPYVFTPFERRRLWAGRIAAVLLAFGGGAFALWAIHVHYLPLETLAQEALEKAKLDGFVEMVRQRFE
jgi:polysaccharide biosynthesis transport protein